MTQNVDPSDYNVNAPIIPPGRAKSVRTLPNVTNSLVDTLELNRRRLKASKLLAVFDRDGTLAPITDDPRQAVVPREVRDLLARLAQARGVKAGVLSARSLRRLEGDFGGCNLILAGNYGLEIYIPGHEQFRHPQAERWRPLLVRARDSLAEGLGAQTGAILEDHGFSLCLHWHLTPARMRGVVDGAVGSLARDFPDLRVRCLPTSYEIWPPIDWDKSASLDEIKKICGLDDWLCLFAGDSEGDEPAFRWVNAQGGISIRVGEKGDSAATCRLQSQRQIVELLRDLVALRRPDR